MPTSAPIRYRITPIDPRAHRFEVRCTVTDPQPDGQVFRLPTWIPGSYLIREFARSIVRIRADDYGRDPVEGVLVFIDTTEIALRRHDDKVGEIVVHFPRLGYDLRAV